MTQHCVTMLQLLMAEAKVDMSQTKCQRPHWYVIHVEDVETNKGGAPVVLFPG